MIEQIEKRIFFRFTRIFAWLIIAPAFIALIYSGYRVATVFAPWSQTVHVSYEEVMDVVDGKKGILDINKGETYPDAKPAKDYQKEIDELMDAFGPVVIRYKAEDFTKKMLFEQDEKDRDQFIKGLIQIVRKSDDDKKIEAAKTYDSVWNMKKAARDMGAASKKADSMMSLSILGGSFVTISIFSLLLVLLAIEKNTRKEADR